MYCVTGLALAPQYYCGRLCFESPSRGQSARGRYQCGMGGLALSGSPNPRTQAWYSVLLWPGPKWRLGLNRYELHDEITNIGKFRSNYPSLAQPACLAALRRLPWLSSTLNVVLDDPAFVRQGDSSLTRCNCPTKHCETSAVSRGVYSKPQIFRVCVHSRCTA